MALDPSLAETGVAFLDQATEWVVTTLSIRTHPGSAEQDHLLELYRNLSTLVKKMRPSDIALELPFVGVNPETAISNANIADAIAVGLCHLRRLKFRKALENRQSLTINHEPRRGHAQGED